MAHSDTHASCPEPAQDFEERYSGGYYFENKDIISEPCKDFQDLKAHAQIYADSFGVKVDIMGRFHNGDSEYIETVKPEVSDET